MLSNANMAPPGNPSMSSEAIQILTSQATRVTFDGMKDGLTQDLHKQYWGRPDWYGEPSPDVELWLQQIRDHFKDDIRSGAEIPDIGYQPPMTRTELLQQPGNAVEELPLKVSYSCLAVSSH